jgi:hypothetical protein
MIIDFQQSIQLDLEGMSLNRFLQYQTYSTEAVHNNTSENVSLLILLPVCFHDKIEQAMKISHLHS